MKPIIKSVIRVSDSFQVFNFKRKVFRLFDTYIGQEIIVEIETVSGQNVFKHIMHDSFDFHCLSVFFRETQFCNFDFICMVTIYNKAIIR